MNLKTMRWSRIALAGAAVLSCAPRPASSQILMVLLFGDKLSSESLQIGIKLDRAFTNLTELDGADMRSGWAFGAFGEIPLSARWSLQPELTMTTAGGAMTFVGDPPGLDGLLPVRTSSRSTQTSWTRSIGGPSALRPRWSSTSTPSEACRARAFISLRSWV